MSALDIDSMRALTVIAETGGITRAAKRLNLSQSAVSHKMKRLERKLNRSLFARTDGKFHLSADGEKLLDYAQRLFKLHDEAYASFHQSDLTGELPKGCAPCYRYYKHQKKHTVGIGDGQAALLS